MEGQANMTDNSIPEVLPSEDLPPEPVAESTESFADMLSQFEKSHARTSDEGAKQLEGTVISVTPDAVFLDIGYKIEGALPRAAMGAKTESVAVGDKFAVSIKGRNEEGYYDLSLLRIAAVTDWASLEEAFAQKSPVVGTVTAQVKGGFSVDVGVRAFMPASRSGAREASEMQDLVGQQITCRIIKLDAAEEDVVVDRRVIAEEEALATRENHFAAIREGDIVSGTVRSLATYGAFVDLGGIDGLLHVSDIAWSRVANPEDILTAGQQLQVKVLKIDADTKRISLGLKQLQPEPWETAAERYVLGQRVTGTVTRLADFGAFVELEPGIEGLIHVSEMSWVKKIHKPSDILKQGDTVEAVILAISPADRRLSLGLKQALGDPWADVSNKFPVDSAIEGPITRITKFGAFVQLAEGIEGLVHISEISAEKRINHPEDVLRVGEIVKAQVLAIDTEKRQIKLSIKQLVPTGFDEYLAEHKVGDIVSGRIVDQSAQQMTIELGQGIRAVCHTGSPVAAAVESAPQPALDLSSLTSMLQSRWKGDTKQPAKPASLRAGQVVSCRITALDAESHTIALELA
jgi:small subunit ribosomal protein S1